MALLEIKDLEVNYGVIKAIKGVSFDVNEGEIIALIGANGAGTEKFFGCVPQGTGIKIKPPQRRR